MRKLLKGKASKAAKLLYVLEKAVDYLNCEEIIIGDGSFNMGRMQVQNGVPFKVFIRLIGIVEAFTPDLSATTFIDFHSVDGFHLCDESFSIFEGISYPNRGLSINNVDITINSAP